MDTSQQPQHSHLFTLRLWAENLGDDQTEWRAQVLLYKIAPIPIRTLVLS
jgi:hypothetical protein